MKKICNVCGTTRESSLVHDMPCLEPGCVGTVSSATAPDPAPSDHPAKVITPVDAPVESPPILRVIHSGDSVIARREPPTELEQILSFIHNRAADLDRLGARGAGDLVRALATDLRNEFLI